MEQNRPLIREVITHYENSFNELRFARTVEIYVSCMDNLVPTKREKHTLKNSFDDLSVKFFATNLATLVESKSPPQ